MKNSDQIISQISGTYPPYKGGIGNTAELITKIFNEINVKVINNVPGRLQNIKKKNYIINYYMGFKLRQTEISPSLIKSPETEYYIFHMPCVGSELLFLKNIIKSKKNIIFQHMWVSGGKTSSFFKWYDAIFTRFYLRYATQIWMTSKDYILFSDKTKIKYLNNQKIKIIPIGVDTNRFYPDSTYRRKEKNLSLLFVGVLDKSHHFKGLHVLLKALTLLNEYNISLIIIGDGNTRSTYEELKRKLNLRNVEFKGKVSDKELVIAMQKADLFILPSTDSSEAYGIVLLEALASGTPVIASDLPGVRTLAIKSGGSIFEVNNYIELAFQIKIVYNLPLTEYNNKRKSAREFSLKYDINMMRNKIINCLRE